MKLAQNEKRDKIENFRKCELILNSPIWSHDFFVLTILFTYFIVSCSRLSLVVNNVFGRMLLSLFANIAHEGTKETLIGQPRLVFLAHAVRVATPEDVRVAVSWNNYGWGWGLKW